MLFKGFWKVFRYHNLQYYFVNTFLLSAEYWLGNFVQCYTPGIRLFWIETFWIVCTKRICRPYYQLILFAEYQSTFRLIIDRSSVGTGSNMSHILPLTHRTWGWKRTVCLCPCGIARTRDWVIVEYQLSVLEYHSTHFGQEVMMLVKILAETW